MPAQLISLSAYRQAKRRTLPRSRNEGAQLAGLALACIGLAILGAVALRVV